MEISHSFVEPFEKGRGDEIVGFVIETIVACPVSTVSWTSFLPERYAKEIVSDKSITNSKRLIAPQIADDFNDLLKFFSDNGIKMNINYLKRDNMYRICTSSKKEVKKIFHLFYDDANFYLSRKYKKFNYYVNTEVSQIISDHRNA